MSNKYNVFTGDHAIRDFLNPGEQPFLPLVELPAKLNPYTELGVKIHAKLMTFSPLNNVKALPAFNMIRELYRRGELETVDNLIENSSGNTVSSLALAARQFGVEKTSSYIPSEISRNKLLMLQFFGVQPIVNLEPEFPEDNDPKSGVGKARLKAKKVGWLNPGQYDNEDNPKAHQKWTAKQIWKQMGGDIELISIGLGTTGTVTGTAKALKKKNKKLRVIGVRREASSYVPGVRTKGLLELVGLNWKNQVDFIEDVASVESYRKSMALSRRGIVVGPSSGFALCGLLNFIDRKIKESALDTLRNKNGKINCVFICPDGPVAYMDEYFKYLGADEFPEILNKELLENMG